MAQFKNLPALCSLLALSFGSTLKAQEAQVPAESSSETPTSQAAPTNTLQKEEIATAPKTRIDEQLQIVGSRLALDDEPGSAQSIEGFELDRYSHGDINRVLRQIPGVNLMEEDGFGLFPNIGLRGTRLERNGHITVMEDGILIAPAPYAASAAYHFPSVSRMSRVEVRKGSAAIKYGPYTTGGALNLLSTPIPAEGVSAQANLLFGSYNSRRDHVWVGGTKGQFGWLIEADNSSSDGFKKLDSDARTSDNMPRPTTGFDKSHKMAKLRWNSAGKSFYQEVELKLAREDMTADETYLGLTQADYDANPFRRYAGSQRDQMNTEHELVQLRHYIELSDKTDITTSLYNMTFGRNWYKLHGVQNAAGGSYGGISGILGNPDSNANAMSWIRGQGTNDVLGNVRANNRNYVSQGIQTQIATRFETGSVSHGLEFGIRHHKDEEDRLQWQDTYRMTNNRMVLVPRGSEIGAEGAVDSREPGSVENRVLSATATALYVQDTMRVGDWVITPGARYEDIKITRTDYFTGNAPRRNEKQGETSNTSNAFLGGLGVTYKINPELLVLAGAHQGFAPSSFDSSIPEEKSWNYELGTRYLRGQFRAELIGFLTQYENLIGTCTAASGGGCEVGDKFDGGKVDVHGIEALALYDIGLAQGWAYQAPVRLGYTFTKSKFKSSFASEFADWLDVEKGDSLPQIPEQQINLSLGVASNIWSLNLNANHVAETRSVAGQGSISKAERIDSRTLLELAGDLRVHKNGRLFASIENLTDETYVVAHSPAGVRPGAPRIVWGGGKIDL